MLQQLVIKLQLPSTIIANQGVTLELIGYRFDPHHQLTHLKERVQFYDNDNIGTIIELIK